MARGGAAFLGDPVGRSAGVRRGGEIGALKRKARTAGALYLALSIAAPLRLIVIPSRLIVRDEAAATAANIVAHETLFRLGILADLVAGTVVLFLTLALYRLFHEVRRSHAALVVILGGLMVTPLYFVNTVNDAAALHLLGGSAFLSPFDEAQRVGLAMLFLQLHDHLVLANQIFWGLWLFPLGALVVRSGFLPRFLGWWLVAGGGAYLAVTLTAFLAPSREPLVSAVTLPAMLGEIAFVLWLLIMGARERPGG